MPRSVAALLAALVAAFALPVAAGEVYQVSTLAALMAGGYDGAAELRQVLAHGDFGLGTLEGVDGELVVLDGRAWQARADGRVVRVGGGARTPFVEVTRFRPDRHVAVSAGLSLAALEELLDRQDAGPGRIQAVRIDGTFAHMTVRSVPKQSPPYRPLAEVVKAQQVTFSHESIAGTLVGFRFPATIGGVNVPGWHLHFLSRDHRVGGHVLALETGKAAAGLEEITDLHVVLPAALPEAPAEAAAYGDQVRAVEGGGK
jgi:acetolactate decarboxylase